MADELGQAFIEIRANLESLTNDLAMARAETQAATTALQSEVQRMSEQMSNSMRGVQRSTEEMTNRFQSGGQRVSESTREMSNAMRAADRQFNQAFQQLGANMSQFGTDTEGLVSRVAELGAQQKKLADQMINDNSRLRGEILQTIGAVLARSNSMDKISANIQRNGEAIHALSGPFMRVGSALENMAKQGNVALVALRELGPQASNKDLMDQINLINQGLMRFQMTGMVAAAGAGLMIAALINLSNTVDGRLIPAGEQFKTVWLKALEPLAKAVTEFFLVIIKAGTAVGEFMAKVRETSPILAGMITGFVALAPVIALVLSPLAVGISTLGSFRAAFTAVFMMIKPFVTGFLTIAGPVILVTGLIVTLIGFFVKLTKESEAFRNAVTNAWNQIKAAAQAAFAPIAPLLGQLKQAFIDMVAAITGSAPNATGVWQAIGQAVANFVNNFVSVAMPAITTAFRVAADILKVGIHALIAVFGLITQFWNEHGPLIKSIVQEVFQAIGVIISNVGNIIKTVFGFIVAALKPIFPLLLQLGGAFIEAVGKIINALSSGKGGTQDFSDTIQQIFTFLQTTVIPIIGEAFRVASMIVQTALNVIIDAVQFLGDFISNAVKLIRAVMEGDWSAAWEAVKNINTAAGEFLTNLLRNLFDLLAKTIIGQSLDEIIAKMKESWESIKNEASAKWNAIKEFFMTWWNGLKSDFQAGIDSIVNPLLSAWNTVKTATETTWNAIKSFLAPIIAFFTDLFKKNFDLWVQIITSTWNLGKFVTMQVWNAIKAFLEPHLQAIKNTFNTIFNAIKTTITTIWNSIKSVTTTIWNAIKSFLTPIWNVIKSAAMSVFNALKSFFSSHFNSVKSNTTSIWTSIKSFISGIWNSISSAGQTFVNNLKNKVVAGWNAIKSQASSIFNAVKNTISSIWNSISSKVGSVVNSMASKVKGAFNSIKSGVTSAWSGVVSAIRSGINRAIDAINRFIRGINSQITKLNKVPGVNFPKVNTIPRLEKGGNILSRGLALVGEKGPELLNLPRGARVSPLGGEGDLDSIRGNTMQLIQHIQAKATPRDLQAFTERALRKIAQQTGLIF